MTDINAMRNKLRDAVLRIRIGLPLKDGATQESLIEEALSIIDEQASRIEELEIEDWP